MKLDYLFSPYWQAAHTMLIHKKIYINKVHNSCHGYKHWYFLHIFWRDTLGMTLMGPKVCLLGSVLCIIWSLTKEQWSNFKKYKDSNLTCFFFLVVFFKYTSFAIEVFCLKYKTWKQPSLNLDHTQRSSLACLTTAFSHPIYFLGFSQIMLCQPLLRQNEVVFTSRLFHFICVVPNWTLCTDTRTGTGQRSYEWGLCCAPLKRVCVSFYGLQEVGCLGCSFGVCTSVCVDNVRVRPQACESICMCGWLRLRICCM